MSEHDFLFFFGLRLYSNPQDSRLMI